MNITGIIAEYNPFHNGHKYHLESARNQTHADYIIVIMSGDYTQRGLPAIADKYTRAQMALENGADLVLELPLPFATGSAEYFASGAVALLDKLGVAGSLCFGSEHGDIATLQTIAEFLAWEPENYKTTLQAGLKKGLSFPMARKNALLSCIPNGLETEDLETVLSSPNNILGIEYIKALLRRQSSILPVTVPRSGSGYHDGRLNGPFSSATSIRNALSEAGMPEAIACHVPESVYRILQDGWMRSFPVVPEDFSLLLQYRLLTEDRSSLYQYADVSGDLADKIGKNLPAFHSFLSFCGLLKTKELTHTRLTRSMLHILLNVRSAEIQEYRENDWVFYARVLGLKESAGPLINAIKQASAIPLISRLPEAEDLLNDVALSMFKKEITASHIYEAVISQKFHSSFRNEYTRRILVR